MSRISELQKQLKAFDGIDPEEARAALAQVQAVKDKRLIEQGDVDKVIQGRVDRLNADHAKEITAISTALQSVEGELADVKIFSAIESAAVKAGMLPSADVDVMNRARSVWSLRDGEPVAVDPDTKSPILDGKGNRISVEGWVDNLAASHGYLFGADDAGGGSNGGRRVIDITKGDNAIGRNLEAFAKGEVVAA